MFSKLGQFSQLIRHAPCFQFNMVQCSSKTIIAQSPFFFHILLRCNIKGNIGMLIEIVNISGVLRDLVPFAQFKKREKHPLRSDTSPEVALYLYKSTIRPCMEYCCHVWAGSPSCYLDMLDKLRSGYVGLLVQHLQPLLSRWIIVEKWSA